MLLLLDIPGREDFSFILISISTKRSSTTATFNHVPLSDRPNLNSSAVAC